MTKPDYCPIAQEPCQAMCILTGLRCILRPARPASTEDLKVYQSIADNYKKGTTMNQNDQMREALRLALTALKKVRHVDQQHSEAERAIEQALDHVNDTPKIEHDSDDVLKPAKLVRLTEYELVGLMYDSNALPECQPTQKELIKFAEFVQTAFLKKNGG